MPNITYMNFEREWLIFEKVMENRAKNKFDIGLKMRFFGTSGAILTAKIA